MTLLDRLLGHDVETTRHLLTLALSLSDEDLDRVFDVGWGSLRRTFDHMISNIEIWTALMRGWPIPGDQETSVAALLSRLDVSYEHFAQLAREIEREGRLDDLWTDVLDHPPKQKSFGGAIGHVITHNIHHRAELLHIMQRLGLPDLPEGDLMGWDQRRRLSQSLIEPDTHKDIRND